MVVHRKNKKVPSNFEDYENIFETVATRDFRFMRMINGIFFGADIRDQFPIACNFDFFRSIEFDKGCYLGQETSARQHFTGDFN